MVRRLTVDPSNLLARFVFAVALEFSAGTGHSSEQSFALRDSELAHWSFQAVKRPALPAVRNAAWPKTAMDRFILAALEAKGIAPAPPATKEQLIRRITFDLIGLPPTPEEIDAFINDRSPEADAELIDRLLASPHYGERWGRHWLDLARFAESDGFEHDSVRPNAWRYRDYVIQSFNADKPFDRFIKEQLAGDELYPKQTDALIATAFNLLGPDMVDSSDQIQRRHNTLNDMTDTSGLVFLGLTIACARCHDHKFEPFSQTDYYQLQAFFSSVVFRNDLPVPTSVEEAAHQAALQDYNARTQEQREELAAFEAPYRQKLYEEKLAKLSPEAQLAHRTPAGERTPEQTNQIQETTALLEVTDKEILKIMSDHDQSRHKRLRADLAKVPKPPPLPMTLALQNPTNAAAKTFILIRGEHQSPGQQVQPGFPLALEQAARAHARAGSASGDVALSDPKAHPGAAAKVASRAVLAEWVASPDHPLTARVMVNRIWQHHFGIGIVSSPSDFGLRGQRPTHPELLDWLASEFVERGWSIKQMHKLLLLSAVYQQSSFSSAEALARDPGNRLFSRLERLRLEGEGIRDSLLAISGRLNRDLGGPGVFPPIPEELFKGAKGWTVSNHAQQHNRRSVYIFARRNLRFPFLEVFDAPDSNLSCPERSMSTSAPQSLTLLNSDEAVAASQATAARLMNQAASDKERILLAYRLTLGRYPTEKERAQARAFLSTSPWSEFCRVLFNLNAFVYLD